MKYAYPATVAEDSEEPGKFNICIPDIYGAVAEAYGEENIMGVAEDLLTEMIMVASNQLGEPHTVAEAEKAFPSKKIIWVEVEY